MKKYVLALSLGKGILDSESREYTRMKEYAKELAEYHIIVLGKHTKTTQFQDGNLYVYAPKARTKIGAFYAAFRTASRVLRARRGLFVVTSQDPFETSVLGLLLAHCYSAQHHVQAHGDFFGSTLWLKERFLNPFRRRLGLFVIRRSHGVRVVSERIKNSLVLHGIPAEHITVLPIRPELDAFLAVTHAEHEGPLRIVTASRLSPEKNIARIIESVATLKKEGRAVLLEIVGSGPCEEELKANAEKFGISSEVVFTSWVHNMSEVYARADIFALASNHEGYALVLVEALAAGVPVVTTDVGCAGEVVRDDVHGYVVPPGDAHAYLAALRALLDDAPLRHRMGEAGRVLGSTLSRVSYTDYVRAWVASLP